MVIVDTSVWIDYFKDISNPHTDLLERELLKVRIGVPALILCELLQGAGTDSVAERIRMDLSAFEILSMGGESLAVAAAGNYRLLRGKGFTIRNTVDCIIATFCIQERHMLLHRDRDFRVFEQYLGLKVVHPFADEIKR